MGELILLRHGETEWSRALRHTGRTDLPLTPAGEAAAAALASALASLPVRTAFTSPARRAVTTAALAGPADGGDPGRAARLVPVAGRGHPGRRRPSRRDPHPGGRAGGCGAAPGAPAAGGRR